jgi:hypothetical protein
MCRSIPQRGIGRYPALGPDPCGASFNAGKARALSIWTRYLGCVSPSLRRTWRSLTLADPAVLHCSGSRCTRVERAVVPTRPAKAAGRFCGWWCPATSNMPLPSLVGSLISDRRQDDLSLSGLHQWCWSSWNRTCDGSHTSALRGLCQSRRARHGASHRLAADCLAHALP